MVTVLIQRKLLMQCPFSRIIRIVAVLLLTQAISGCISLQFEKRQEGVDVLAPPVEFLQKKTVLDEILSSYGAPTDIVAMNGDDFALHYRKALYKGMDVSFGIPLQNLMLYSSLGAYGNLLHSDAVVFIFTADGVVKDMKYEKGSNRSFWDDYWH